jgi:Uma2 family endonuclease
MMTPLLDLETLFIAGLPSNKLELFDGRVPCYMAFSSREEAEATFEHWVAVLCRWKEAPPEMKKDARLWKCVVAGFELRLERRRIDARVPLCGGALYEFSMNFWDAELWPPGGGGTSFAAFEQAERKLVRAFRFEREQDDAKICSRTDLVLTERSVLTPDFYGLRPGTWAWVGGERAYLGGVPEIVIEVVTPPTRDDDLPGSGRRAAVLARAGVRSYCLVDPGNSTLTAYELEGSRYRPVEELRPGDVFRPRFPAGVRLEVSKLFEVEWEVPPVLVVGKQPKADDPAWLAPDEPIAIEHLLLEGHPRRRYEVIDDIAPCVLAFRDPAKARTNFEHWAREAARIEGIAPPGQIGDTFEAGRFRLWRDANRIHLDLRYSGSLQRRILETIQQDGVWDTEPEEGV